MPIAVSKSKFTMSFNVIVGRPFRSLVGLTVIRRLTSNQMVGADLAAAYLGPIIDLASLSLHTCRDRTQKTVYRIHLLANSSSQRRTV